MISVIRTSSENIDFENLVNQLNSYLKIIDGDDHAFYNQYNNIDVLKNVIIVYVNEKASGCGAFKVFDKNTVEIKRMYTCPEDRKKGVASKALKALENWARELGYRNIILETGKRQVEAVNFYKKMNYTLIPNFNPYQGVENSLCFKKELI